MTRPERIDQVIPSIIEHDAVSSHTFGAQRLLREMGFSSEIYASTIGPGTEGRVRRLAELAAGDARQWLLYQASIGSPAAEVFARHLGVKLLDYHNITPAELVEDWLPPLGAEARLGRQQLAWLAPLVGYAVADSPYNARELSSFGFANVEVAPLLIDPHNLNGEADEATFARLVEQKRDGGADWLFVGQIAPHKAQHDIVKAFACYRHVYDPNARLHLVGREMGSSYIDALRRFIRAIGLDDAVELAGSVPSATLVAYYQAADVFVCCSEHEGFCAPVTEAMHRAIPVVSYGAAALAETIADGGVVLDDKSPAVVAAAVHEVLSDKDLCLELSKAGVEQANKFNLEASERTFVAAIERAIALLDT